MRHAGASNTIKDNRISLTGGNGLTLGVKGPINYLVILSDEGVDMNLVADDNVTGVLPPMAVKSAGKGRPGFALSACPNPFNPAVTVRCFLPCGESAAYDIYNMQGKRVRSFSVPGKAGQGVLVWDGRDGLGKAVVSGLYFGRLQTSGGKSASHQLLLCR